MTSVYSGSIPPDQLLHSRLGHPGNNDALLKRLQTALGKKPNFSFMCASCMLSKASRLSGEHNTTAKRRATRVGERLHGDMIVMPNDNSVGGNRYCAIFVDEFSDEIFPYPMKRKSEFLQIFKDLLRQLQTRTAELLA